MTNDESATTIAVNMCICAVWEQEGVATGTNRGGAWQTELHACKISVCVCVCVYLARLPASPSPQCAQPLERCSRPPANDSYIEYTKISIFTQCESETKSVYVCLSGVPVVWGRPSQLCSAAQCQGHGGQTPSPECLHLWPEPPQLEPPATHTCGLFTQGHWML